ncbi:MAG: transposase [Planctomycetota bacterium]|jgi:REP element-mobilizing transposase RayT
MGRGRRRRVLEELGSYHIVSRLLPELEWWDDAEKEEVLRLLERLARGFFVQIHAFCIMSNHFHVLVTAQERAAADASERDLVRRYRAIFGKRAEPPLGEQQRDGSVDPDGDGGIERLRERLGDVSRFVQEFKQTIGRRYNARRGRRGTIWQDRFRSVVTEKAGDAEITQAAYIDLNPIRAGLVRVPEDYRWSSAGLRVRSPGRAKRLLAPIHHPELRRIGERWYRQFLYCAGVAVPKGKPATVGRISAADAQAIVQRQGALGIFQRLHYRCRNLSEGIVVGSAGFVERLQREQGQLRARGRPFLEPAPEAGSGNHQPPLCGTRVLDPARSP